MERTPPYNLEAEQAVLAAVLLDNHALAVVMAQLEPDDFYLETHRVIMTGMREMFDRSTPVDVITLADHLQATGRLDLGGGPATISNLAGSVSTAANVEYWAEIVKDKGLLRRVIGEATALVTEAYDQPEDVEEFLDRAEAKILEIGASQTRTTYQPINKVVERSFKIIEDMEKRKGEVVGVPTGYADLDVMTGGLQNTDLIILAARPSMGKTALALNIVTHAAIEHEKAIAFFSLEMAATQLVMRMICADAKVPLQLIRSGQIRPYWTKISNSANKLGTAKIFIDDSSALSVLEIKAKARRIAAEHGLGLVVVDYLQLLRGGGGKRRDSREQEISEISRGLKGMAKELDLPVLALSQLNRSPEARESGEPRLSDLRESGALEQDADVVLMLHRPGLYKKKEEGKDEVYDPFTVLKIEKQRNGPTGKVDLVFFREFTRFESAEKRYNEDAVPGVPF